MKQNQLVSSSRPQKPAESLEKPSASNADTPAGLLLSIDPGADSGWAVWDISSRTLLHCGFRYKPNALDAAGGITRVVIERPHAGSTGARKKDVITLAIRAGELGGLVRYLTGVEPEYIEPASWKGSTPKEISNVRIKRRLTPVEECVFQHDCRGVAKGKQNNVLDAIGIGLRILGRS